MCLTILNGFEIVTVCWQLAGYVKSQFHNSICDEAYKMDQNVIKYERQMHFHSLKFIFNPRSARNPQPIHHL